MVKVRQLPTRQRVRKALLLISLLLLPVTLYYFSPALILGAAYDGVINGSFIVFGLMFLASLFVGRLWCGWVCPVGGLQELAAPVNDRLVHRRAHLIKWAIWFPWIGLIVTLAIRAGGYHAVDPLYQLDGGLTLAIPTEPGAPPWYMIYYIVVGLFALAAVAVGRRAACHTICWMAPFMVIGRKIRNAARWPALRLRADASRCKDCQTCTRGCPMSLDVHSMVKAQSLEHSECILCGTCVDNCPQEAIRYSFHQGR